MNIISPITEAKPIRVIFTGIVSFCLFHTTKLQFFAIVFGFSLVALSLIALIKIVKTINQNNAFNALRKTLAQNLKSIASKLKQYVNERNKRPTVPLEELPNNETKNFEHSVADEIAKLAELKSQGHLTDEEFLNLKSKLISEL